MFINPNNSGTINNTLQSNSLLSNLNATLSQKNQVNNGTIYAGNLNSTSNTTSSPLQEMKDKFKKQAQQVISNQIEKEMDFLNNLKEIEDSIGDLEVEMKNKEESMQNMKAEKQTLMDSYGITANSPEEKQLKLLERAKYRPESLTEDEKKQLDDIGELTDYQRQSLAINESIACTSDEIQNLCSQIESTKIAIIEIKIDKMKSNPMADAKRTAKELLEEGNKQLFKEAGKQAIDTINESLTPDEETTDSTEATETQENTTAQETEAQDPNKQINAEDQLDYSKLEEAQKNATDLKTQLLTMANKNHLVPNETLGIIVDALL